MTAVRFGVFLALAAALYGQTKPSDIAGWDKIRWGMTIAEARAAYNIYAETESKDNWTLLYLNPVKIGGVEMGVQVGARPGEKMPGSDRIAMVRLWSFFGLPSSTPLSGSQDFDALKTTLTQQYGHPTDEETKRGENNHIIKTVLWTFPSTSILLSLEQSALLPNVGTIYLDYTAAGK